MNVWVVTRPDLGWDSVVGVFMGVTMADLKKEYPYPEYIIQDHTVETQVESEFFDDEEILT